MLALKIVLTGRMFVLLRSMLHTPKGNYSQKSLVISHWSSVKRRKKRIDSPDLRPWNDKTGEGKETVVSTSYSAISLLLKPQTIQGINRFSAL